MKRSTNSRRITSSSPRGASSPRTSSSFGSNTSGRMKWTLCGCDRIRMSSTFTTIFRISASEKLRPAQHTSDRKNALDHIVGGVFIFALRGEGAGGFVTYNTPHDGKKIETCGSVGLARSVFFFWTCALPLQPIEGHRHEANVQRQGHSV